MQAAEQFVETSTTNTSAIGAAAEAAVPRPGAGDDGSNCLQKASQALSISAADVKVTAERVMESPLTTAASPPHTTDSRAAEAVVSVEAVDSAAAPASVIDSTTTAAAALVAADTDRAKDVGKSIFSEEVAEDVTELKEEVKEQVVSSLVQQQEQLQAAKTQKKEDLSGSMTWESPVTDEASRCRPTKLDRGSSLHFSIKPAFEEKEETSAVQQREPHTFFAARTTNQKPACSPGQMFLGPTTTEDQPEPAAPTGDTSSFPPQTAAVLKKASPSFSLQIRTGHAGAGVTDSLLAKTVEGHTLSAAAAAAESAVSSEGFAQNSSLQTAATVAASVKDSASAGSHESPGFHKKAADDTEEEKEDIKRLQRHIEEVERKLRGMYEQQVTALSELLSHQKQASGVDPLSNQGEPTPLMTAAAPVRVSMEALRSSYSNLQRAASRRVVKKLAAAEKSAIPGKSDAETFCFLRLTQQQVLHAAVEAVEKKHHFLQRHTSGSSSGGNSGRFLFFSRPGRKPAVKATNIPYRHHLVHCRREDDTPPPAATTTGIFSSASSFSSAFCSSCSCRSSCCGEKTCMHYVLAPLLQSWDFSANRQPPIFPLSNNSHSSRNSEGSTTSSPSSRIITTPPTTTNNKTISNTTHTTTCPLSTSTSTTTTTNIPTTAAMDRSLEVLAIPNKFTTTTITTPSLNSTTNTTASSTTAVVSAIAPDKKSSRSSSSENSANENSSNSSGSNCHIRNSSSSGKSSSSSSGNSSSGRSRNSSPCSSSGLITNNTSGCSNSNSSSSIISDTPPTSSSRISSCGGSGGESSDFLLFLRKSGGFRIAASRLMKNAGISADAQACGCCCCLRLLSDSSSSSNSSSSSSEEEESACKKSGITTAAAARFDTAKSEKEISSRQLTFQQSHRISHGDDRSVSSKKKKSLLPRKKNKRISAVSVASSASADGGSASAPTAYTNARSSRSGSSSSSSSSHNKRSSGSSATIFRGGKSSENLRGASISSRLQEEGESSATFSARKEQMAALLVSSPLVKNQPLHSTSLQKLLPKSQLLGSCSSSSHPAAAAVVVAPSSAAAQRRLFQGNFDDQRAPQKAAAAAAPAAAHALKSTYISSSGTTAGGGDGTRRKYTSATTTSSSYSANKSSRSSKKNSSHSHTNRLKSSRGGWLKKEEEEDAEGLGGAVAQDSRLGTEGGGAGSWPFFSHGAEEKRALSSTIPTAAPPQSLTSLAAGTHSCTMTTHAPPSSSRREGPAKKPSRIRTAVPILPLLSRSLTHALGSQKKTPKNTPSRRRQLHATPSPSSAHPALQRQQQQQRRISQRDSSSSTTGSEDEEDDSSSSSSGSSSSGSSGASSSEEEDEAESEETAILAETGGPRSQFQKTEGSKKKHRDLVVKRLQLHHRKKSRDGAELTAATSTPRVDHLTGSAAALIPRHSENAAIDVAAVKARLVQLCDQGGPQQLPVLKESCAATFLRLMQEVCVVPSLQHFVIRVLLRSSEKVLPRFLQMNGLQLLREWLEFVSGSFDLFEENESFVQSILKLLLKLQPTRQEIAQAKIAGLINSMRLRRKGQKYNFEACSVEVASLSQRVVDAWKALCVSSRTVASTASTAISSAGGGVAAKVSGASNELLHASPSRSSSSSSSGNISGLKSSCSLSNSSSNSSVDFSTDVAISSTAAASGQQPFSSSGTKGLQGTERSADLKKGQKKAPSAPSAATTIDMTTLPAPTGGGAGVQQQVVPRSQLFAAEKTSETPFKTGAVDANKKRAEVEAVLTALEQLGKVLDDKAKRRRMEEDGTYSPTADDEVRAELPSIPPPLSSVSEAPLAAAPAAESTAPARRVHFGALGDTLASIVFFNALEEPACVKTALLSGEELKGAAAAQHLVQFKRSHADAEKFAFLRKKYMFKEARKTASFTPSPTVQESVEDAEEETQDPLKESRLPAVKIQFTPPMKIDFSGVPQPHRHPNPAPPTKDPPPGAPVLWIEAPKQLFPEFLPFAFQQVPVIASDSQSAAASALPNALRSATDSVLHAIAAADNGKTVIAGQLHGTASSSAGKAAAITNVAASASAAPATAIAATSLHDAPAAVAAAVPQPLGSDVGTQQSRVYVAPPNALPYYSPPCFPPPLPAPAGGNFPTPFAPPYNEVSASSQMMMPHQYSPREFNASLPNVPPRAFFRPPRPPSEPFPAAGGSAHGATAHHISRVASSGKNVFIGSGVSRGGYHRGGRGRSLGGARRPWTTRGAAAERGRGVK